MPNDSRVPGSGTRTGAVQSSVQLRAVEPLREVRVLIVDDNPDALDMSELLLSGYGAVVECASCADEAMKAILRQRPDVVLSDISMPGRDGYSLVREIRCHDRALPCIAFTALAGCEDRIHALEAGFNSYLLKPAEPHELVALVRSLVPSTDRHEAGAL